DPVDPAVAVGDTNSYRLEGGFPDGVSNTIIFAARFSRGQNGDETLEPIRTMITAHPARPRRAYFGAPKPPSTAKATCPVGSECTFQSAPSMRDAMMTPSAYGHSYGSGGLSVCMADCVVRQMHPAVRVDTWQLLVHPNDRQKIDDPEWE